MDSPIGAMRCDELNDLDAGIISVSELIVKLQAVQAKYGVKSKLFLDAGYNNISVEVIPSKKLKSKS